MVTVADDGVDRRWNLFDDIVDDPIRTAETPEELWIALMLHDGGLARSDGDDAESGFRRLHGDGEPGALTTALLLLTSWRHHSCTAQLVKRLVATELLTDDELDELAETLFFADKVQLQAPAEWVLPQLFAEIDLGDGDEIELADVGDVKLGDDDDVLFSADDDSERLDKDDALGDPGDETVSAVFDADMLTTMPSRTIRPPLRRWSAERVVRRDPALLADVRDRIGALERHDAAAAMMGVLDAVDCLPERDAGAVIETALRWPHKSVRKQGLELLAARGEAKRARSRAARDGDASIRAFAPRLRAPSVGSDQARDTAALF